MKGRTAARIEGLGDAPIDDWIGDVTSDVVPPVTGRRLPGGHSNLTYLIEGADGRRFVLRRPPLGTLLGSAHDVGRERRVLLALEGTGVPVPAVVGWYEDDDLIGAPFFVMEYVDGLVLRSPGDARHLTASARGAATSAVVDTLSQLHRVDPDAVGLGDLGRREQYVARQVKRWLRQLGGSDEGQGEEFRGLADGLLAGQPADHRGTAIVHGDYKVDNLVLSRSGQVCAVLDWELCTLGDPLADVGLFLAYWGDDVSREAQFQPPNRAPGFDSPADVRGRLASAYEVSPETLRHYEAFGYWKVAAITEGVRRRYDAGAYGEHALDTHVLARRVEGLLGRCRALLAEEAG